MQSIKDIIRSIGNKHANSVSNSVFYDVDKEIITTELPLLNIALSGAIDGGLQTGLTLIGGESKCYKTMMALTCAKSYLEKYPESYLFFFDCEFGASTDYFRSVGLDTERIIHIPVVSIEEFKNQSIALLKSLDRGDKAFIILDSLGALASNKSIEDADERKDSTDMTRAKVISGAMRLLTPQLNLKDIPCVIINHIYESMDKYTAPIMGGGKGVMYAANTVIFLTKTPIKTDEKIKEIIGYTFKINIVKSRYIKEGRKLEFDVMYDEGVRRLSGISELAQEYGVITTSGGWYTEVDLNTKESIGAKFRSSSERYTEILERLLDDPKFNSFVQKKYKLVSE
jgi:RecA/RadA recombinase